ncbi:Sensor histidine kinase YpdA [compost metagenome]
MNKYFIDKKWVTEIVIVVFTFVLFTLSDWILIKSWRSFFLGIAYFLVLYLHAQCNRFYIMPFLINKRNIILYVVYTILGLLIFGAVMSQIAKIILYKDCFLNNNPAKLAFQYHLGILLGSYICIAGPSLLVDQFRKHRYETDQELTHRKIKIDLLNKQLNPHFLFNTLNTIYGMSLERPERTSETILKVSDLLRYQVENGKKEQVSVKDEIDFIKSYIAIEKERLGYRCHIHFKAEVNDAEKISIAPMIIFTFVENAFKHGTDLIKDCFIDISMEYSDKLLTLQITNSLPNRPGAEIVSTHTGLDNTRARLEMLYPKKYKLNLHRDDSRFFTELKIEI